jgi:nitroimidazol reductase NimA-like FMN-containing flavoprotein (pyridoxamine 5'-phosphate oxidase superfamily)
MLINEIAEMECRELLGRAVIGRLGCSRDDQPYVVPIGIAYEGDYIYVFSTLGKKIKWMRDNPKVCVQVDETSENSAWASVIANGEYEELPNPQFAQERAHARSLLEKRHQWWLNALAERRIQVSDVEIEPIFFRIRILSLTGLRGESEKE